MKNRLNVGHTLKSMLIFLGSFIFAASLTVLIHETGHALALLILDYPDINLVATPFFGVTTSSSSIDVNDAAFIFAAGSIFDLFCATIITLILWRKRSVKLLPILMYGGAAYLLEGIIMFNTFFTPNILTDWDGIIYLGFSPFLVAVLAGIVLVVGTLLMYLIWPLVNISSQDSFLKIFIITLGFIMYFFLSFIFSMMYNLILPPEILLLIFLNVIVSVSILIIMIVFYKPLFPLIDRVSHTVVNDSSWSVVWLSLGSAVTIFLFLMLFFN